MLASSLEPVKRLHVSFLLWTLLFAGCAQVPPAPLTEASSNQALKDPDATTVRVATSELRHPMLPPIEVDLARGLSPQEAAVVAVVLNPELRAERDRKAIATAQLLQAGLLPNPQLAANLDFPSHASPPDDFTAYGVGLSWDVTALLALKANQRAAGAEASAVQLDVAWKEWQTAQSAKTSAFNVLALRRALAVAREVEGQLSESLRVVRKAVESHDKTVLELSAAEGVMREAHDLVLAQERDLAHERLALNQLLGLSPEANVRLREMKLPSSLDPPPAEELLRDMPCRRLDLVALQHGYQSQEATLRAAVLGQFPKINAGINAARDTSDVKTIGVGLTIDLPVFDRNQGTIAIGKATRQKLFDEYTARVFAARADIAIARTEIQSINHQLTAIDETIASLRQLVETYETAVNRGETDVVALYTVRSDLAKKRIDAMKLRQELVQNWIALELASGQTLNFEGSNP
jgi:outer membrane protein TolC